MSGQCELCSNVHSIRVFPCLYHCKKMLCIEHLSEHEQWMAKQSQLGKLWENFQGIFQEKKVEEQLSKLQMKLENYRKLKEDIENFLSSKDFHQSNECQRAIEMIEKAIEEETIPKNTPLKIERESNNHEEDRDLTGFFSSASLSSSITTNEDFDPIPSSPSSSNVNENTPVDEDSFQQMDQSNDREDSTEFEQSNRKIVPSSVRDYCPLTRDGAFGIHSHIHGIRLCPSRPREYQRTCLLSRHFRRVHHLTPSVSLTIARAIGSGQDPMETRLFNEDQVILNLDELRSVNCPMNKPLTHYPFLQIPHYPCNTIKQVRHLKDHLRRVHQLTNPAANLIIKVVKNDLPIERIQFPPHINILQTDDQI